MRLEASFKLRNMFDGGSSPTPNVFGFLYFVQFADYYEDGYNWEVVKEIRVIEGEGDYGSV